MIFDLELLDDRLALGSSEFQLLFEPFDSCVDVFEFLVWCGHERGFYNHKHFEVFKAKRIVISFESIERNLTRRGNQKIVVKSFAS